MAKIQNDFNQGDYDTFITAFTRKSAAALIQFLTPRVQRLIEGGAYLKIGRYKEFVSFNITVYLPSVRKTYI